MSSDDPPLETSVHLIDVPRRTGGERRHDAIQSAIDVIIERGYEHARFADVAKRSSIAIATLQYYFGSREAMLQEALVTAANDDIAHLRTQVADIADPLQQLEHLIAYTLNAENWDNRKDAIWIELYRVGIRDPIVRQIAEEYDRLWRLPFLEALQQGVATGKFVLNDVPEFVAIRLVAMLNGVWLVVLNDAGDQFQDRYQRAVLGDLYHWVGVT